MIGCQVPFQKNYREHSAIWHACALYLAFQIPGTWIDAFVVGSTWPEIAATILHGHADDTGGVIAMIVILKFSRDWGRHPSPETK